MPGRDVRAELGAAVLDARVVRVAGLEHREAEPHDAAAFDLPLDERRVDRPADVEALPEMRDVGYRPSHRPLRPLPRRWRTRWQSGAAMRRRRWSGSWIGTNGFSSAPVPVISSP